ncbi:hypothetical protein NTGM5_160021 [Candidatus Nitrotoga sp. M5]|nr:hypothetical protein NTGM5_160021 [Candidatus Nitrotoga sp. M5]
MLETPGILLVTLGRDKLNWAEIDTDWAADINSSHWMDYHQRMRINSCNKCRLMMKPCVPRLSNQPRD